jgi:hypothetical protein
MLNNLPTDILINIYDYINPITVLSLKKVDKKLQYKILSIEKYLLIKELKNNDDNVKNCNHLYKWFEMYFRSIYESQKSYILKNLISKNLQSNGMFIREIIINNIKKNYSYHTKNDNVININILFKKLYIFFLENESDDVFVMSNYKNSMELFIFYKIFQISINKSILDISSNILFLNDLQNYNTQDITHKSDKSDKIVNKNEINYLGFYYNFGNIKNISIDYYNYIYSNNIFIKFDELYNMSSVATTLCSLKKIFGYKVLNLSDTVLLPCCNQCSSEFIYYFTCYRFNRKYDDLLCHNYNEIKSFFQRTNTVFYNSMLYNEKMYVNKLIRILNPKTNKLIKLEEIINLSNSVSESASIYRLIRHNQEKLLKKYFC